MHSALPHNRQLDWTRQMSYELYTKFDGSRREEIKPRAHGYASKFKATKWLREKANDTTAIAYTQKCPNSDQSFSIEKKKK